MIQLTTTGIAIVISLVTSAFLARELARKRGQNHQLCFFIGLFLGPLALVFVYAPVPLGRGQGGAELEKQIRVVHGEPCPGCGRELGPRETQCPRCGRAVEHLWWERVSTPV